MTAARFLSRTVAAGAAALTVAACGGSGGSAGGSTPGPATGDPIKVGFLAAQTGPAAIYGVAELAAATVVVDDINKKGGALGRPIKLVPFDDTTNPTKAISGAQQLMEQGVVAILGPNSGSAALAVAPVTNERQIPIIGFVGTLGVTDPSKDFFAYTFRDAVSDENAIPAVWERLKKTGRKKIAIFAEENAYGSLGIDGYKKLAQGQSGMTIVESVTAATNATDVTPQVTRIRNAQPDAVVLQTGQVALASKVAKTAATIGLDVPLYGGLGLSTQALLDAFKGDSKTNIVTLNMFNPDSPVGRQKELISLLQAAGKQPTGFADVLGASGVVIVTEAIKKAGKADGPSIKKALESGISINAYASGPYKYGTQDHTGLGTDAAVWTSVKDGKFVPAST